MDLTLLLPFTIFAVSIFALTYVVRVVTADLFPALAAHAITRDLLTLVPTALGALVAYLALGFPYPEGFASTSGRLIFGLAAGSLSALVYRTIKARLTGSPEAEDSSNGNVVVMSGGQRPKGE
jgi:hypothetical protein